MEDGGGAIAIEDQADDAIGEVLAAFEELLAIALKGIAELVGVEEFALAALAEVGDFGVENGAPAIEDGLPAFNGGLGEEARKLELEAIEVGGDAFEAAFLEGEVTSLLGGSNVGGNCLQAGKDGGEFGVGFSKRTCVGWRSVRLFPRKKKTEARAGKGKVRREQSG